MSDIELPKPEEIEELKANRFTRLVAMTVSAYAVALAISSLGGNNAAKEMMLAQQQASDQWAFYQAKAMREKMCEFNLLHLEFETADRGESMTPAGREQAKLFRDRLTQEKERYGLEKADIKTQAEGLEHKRDVNCLKDPFFDYAEVLLQIAIVLASVSMLASSRPVFLFSVVLAAIGFLLGLNGFALLLKHLPLVGSVLV